MNRKARILLLGTVAGSALFMGATPMQQSALSSVPWWAWLSIVSVVLLILFILVMRLEWKADAQQQSDDE